MILFVSYENSGMIRKISDWFGVNFNPKFSPGYRSVTKNTDRDRKRFTFI